MRRFFEIVMIIIVFLAVFPSLMKSQTNFSTEVLSVRDGLSNNYVHNIIQDQYGYMWFATSDGLNVYDGYQITIFKNIPGDTTSLPHNHVHRLLEDTNGIIWITTENGLARYNRKSKTFKTSRYSESNTEGSNRVFDIFEDSRRKLWVSTRYGTFEFDRLSEKFITYDVMQTDNNIVEFGSAYTGNIFENGNGELFHLTWSFGLVKFDYDASLFVQIALRDNFNKNLEEKVYFSTLFDEEGHLFIGHSNGLVKLDLKNNIGFDITPFKRNPTVTNFRDNAVSGLFLDRNKNILVSTGRHGLLLYNTKIQKFETLINSPSTYFGRFYEDKSGLLWFCSSRGVHKYDYNRKPFEKYIVADEIDNDGNKAVIAFNPSLILKNKVWLGTREGISIFDSKENSISEYPSRFSNLSKFDTLVITSIVENSDGRLWIANK